MPTSMFQAAYGWATALGLAKETVYGTAAAPVLYLPASDDGMVLTNKIIPRMGVRKSIGSTLSNPGQVDVSGTFSVEAEPAVIGQVIALCLGTDAVSGSGPYTHSMKLYAPRPSFTLSADYGDGSTHQWVGCMVDSMDITAKAGGLIEVKIGVVGQNDIIQAGSLSPTLQTVEPFDYQLISTATLAGSALAADSFSISLKNNLAPYYSSGSGRLLRNINSKNAKVTGSFTVAYESDAIANLALNVSNVPLQFNFTHTAIAQGSTPYQLQFIMPNIIIESAALNPKRNDVVMYNVKFTAHETGAGANNDLQVITIDTVSTAYAP